MTSIALGRTRFQAWPVASTPSLDDELRERALGVIPADKFAEHERQTLALWNFLYLRHVVFGLQIISLWAPISWLRRQTADAGTANWLTIAWVAGAMILPFVLHSAGWGLMGALPLVAAGLTFGIIALCEGKFSNWSYARWMNTRVRSVSENGALALKHSQMFLTLPAAPDKVLERAHGASDIPGARLEIRYFGPDPALLAVRGYGPWRTERIIAAWGTGCPTLDDF